MPLFAGRFRNWIKNVTSGMGYSNESGEDTGIQGIGQGTLLGNLLGDARDYFTGWREQEAIDEQNELERETFEYNKDYNAEERIRQDTQYQRGAADMRAAGLLPSMMAGASGAGSSSTRPLAAPDIRPPTKAEKMREAMQTMLQLAMVKAQIGKTNAEQRLTEAQASTEALKPGQIQAQTQTLELANQLAKKLNPIRIEQAMKDLAVTDASTALTKMQTQLSQANITSEQYRQGQLLASKILSQAQARRVDQEIVGLIASAALADANKQYTETRTTTETRNRQWWQRQGLPTNFSPERYGAIWLMLSNAKVPPAIKQMLAKLGMDIANNVPPSMQTMPAHDTTPTPRIPLERTGNPLETIQGH